MLLTNPTYHTHPACYTMHSSTSPPLKGGGKGKREGVKGPKQCLQATRLYRNWPDRVPLIVYYNICSITKGWFITMSLSY